MIIIKCIETEDVYVLSGDDETIQMKVYNALAASLAGIISRNNFLKMHEKDLEYRIALAKFTGFNPAFHAHQRALMLQLAAESKTWVSSAPGFRGQSYYQEF